MLHFMGTPRRLVMFLPFEGVTVGDRRFRFVAGPGPTVRSADPRSNSKRITHES